MIKTYTEDAKVTDDCNVYFDTIPASTKFKIYLDSGREYRGNFLTFFVDETEKDVPNRVDAVGLIEDLQDQFKINILNEYGMEYDFDTKKKLYMFLRGAKNTFKIHVDIEE